MAGMMPEHKEAEEDKPMWWSIIQVRPLHLRTAPGLSCLQVPWHMCRVCKYAPFEYENGSPKELPYICHGSAMM